jgi:hypothetical protein
MKAAMRGEYSPRPFEMTTRSVAPPGRLFVHTSCLLVERPGLSDALIQPSMRQNARRSS